MRTEPLLVNAKHAMSHIQSGMTVMVGGFGGIGSAHGLIEALLETPVQDLTVICNDGGYPNKGVGKWIAAKRVKKLIASHVGNNPLVTEQVRAGTLELTLLPQGILAEKIRAGGSGLQGIVVERKWASSEAQYMEQIGGYYESALIADVSLIAAEMADQSGNLIYKESARNHNPAMAMAGTTTLVEVQLLRASGKLDPAAIVTPGIFVSHLILAGGVAHAINGK